MILGASSRHVGALGATSRAVGARTAASKPAGYLLLFSSFVLGALAAFNIFSQTDVSESWPYVAAAAFTGWAVIYALTTYKCFGTVYLFGSAYVLCLAVFHLGHLFAHVTGLFDLTYLVRGSMAYWYQQAGWYCLLAFACLGVGVALSLKFQRVPVWANPVSEVAVKVHLANAYWIGFALLLAAFAGLALTVGSVGNILQFSRAQIFGGVGDTRGLGFFLMVAPSALILMFATASTRGQKWFAYTTCAVLVLVILFLGYRSSVMFPGLIAAILWVKLGKRIPLPVAIVAVLIVVIAIPSVRYLRAQGAYQDLSSQDLAASLEEAQDTKDILIELGGVSVVVAYVLKTVPEEWPYRLGQSYWLAVQTAIPNVGLQIEGSGRADFLGRGVADREALSTMHPADWYTYIVDRWLFDRGGGAGFSTIAEAYLNFGALGVVGYFLTLGFLLGRLDQVDLRMRPKLLIFSGAMIWPLLKTVRNSFGVFLKPVAFIVVSILIWRLATFWLRRDKR